MSSSLQLENTVLGTVRLVLRQHDFGGTAKTVIVDSLMPGQVEALQEGGVHGPNPGINYGVRDPEVEALVHRPLTPLPPADFGLPTDLEPQAPVVETLVFLSINTAVGQDIEDRLNQYERDTGFKIVQLERVSEAFVAPKCNGGEDGLWYRLTILARGPAASPSKAV